jgi:ABC-type glycerol-3-phosphate transport system substrate-binding protein
MKSGKKASILILVLILITSMVACSSNNGQTASTTPTASNTAEPANPSEEAPKTQSPVEIKWAMQGAANELAGWQAVTDAANAQLKEKGITITIQKINTSSWDEYYQKITAQIAGGNIPDIGRIAESLMPQVISKDQVVELTPYLSEIDMSQYFEGTLDNAGKQNGKSYGLPSGVYQFLLYYNKDMFDAKGIPYPSSDWDNPITLEQVVEYSKKLTEGEGATKKFGYYGNADIFAIGSLAGEYLYKIDGTYQFTDNHKKAFDMLNTMLTVDLSMPTPVDTKIMGGMDMFRAGRVAMCNEGTWWQQTVRDITDFNVGIAAAPAVQGKAKSSAFIDNYVIWKGGKYEKESWEALKAIFSEEGFNELAKTGTGGVPVNRNTLDNLSDQLIGSVFDDTSKASFIQALDHTMTMPYNTKYNEISQKATSVLETWMVGKKSTDDTIQELKEYLDKATKN